MIWAHALFTPCGVAGTPSSTGCALFVRSLELLTSEVSHVLV